MHNRIDVTAKSFFWDFVELNNAYVYCTSDPFPHMSEIIHCYYYTKRVCNAAVVALVGAFAGGNIAQAATGDQPPADGSGTTISTGMLLTLNGNMRQLEEDNKANCLWWVHHTQIHGRILAGTHQPFSYCDIDEQFTIDACERTISGDGPSPANGIK
jgi:hypothetical protein